MSTASLESGPGVVFISCQFLISCCRRRIFFWPQAQAPLSEALCSDMCYTEKIGHQSWRVKLVVCEVKMIGREVWNLFHFSFLSYNYAVYSPIRGCYENQAYLVLLSFSLYCQTLFRVLSPGVLVHSGL